MAASFDEVMARTPAENRTAREKREEVVAQIFQDVEQQSVALSLGNVFQMNQFQTRMRVSNTVPQAKWINGTTSAGDAPFGSNNNDDTNQVAKDSGLKQTTNATWENKYITPDEIAVQVVMPDSWRDDSDLAWEEIRKLLRSAFAQTIDSAILWGRTMDASPIPSTFGNGLVADTVAAGNITVEGVGVDLADDYARFYQDIEERGYMANTAIVNAAEVWRLRRLRSEGPEGLPIYQSLDAAGNGTIYGRPLREVRNGTFRPTVATAVGGDWSQLHIGIRQGMTFETSRHASLYDASGNVVYDAWQQDGEILRAVMRLGYVVTDPYMYQTGQREYPFQILAPENYSS